MTTELTENYTEDTFKFEAFFNDLDDYEAYDLNLNKQTVEKDVINAITKNPNTIEYNRHYPNPRCPRYTPEFSSIDYRRQALFEKRVIIAIFNSFYLGCLYYYYISVGLDFCFFILLAVYPFILYMWHIRKYRRD